MKIYHIYVRLYLKDILFFQEDGGFKWNASTVHVTIKITKIKKHPPFHALLLYNLWVASFALIKLKWPKK